MRAIVQRTIALIVFLSGLAASTGSLSAQDAPITVATVERAPFSFMDDGENVGFSIDLISQIAEQLDRPIEIIRFDSFGAMLDAVTDGQADLAAANISVTSAREEILDFSRPIFASGLQIMAQRDTSGTSVFRVLFSAEVLLAIIAAFALLLCGGMLMWRLERNAQPYFELSAKDAPFPAFWWALNLVVNGGFEERVPRTVWGRVLGTFLVISSLFIVSVFVAKITSVLTVNAINSNISGPADLYDYRVATVEGSTASTFMDQRDIRFDGYEGLDSLLAAFESGAAEVVVFDAPVLQYYANTQGRDFAEMVGSVFLRENYGFALQSDSPLAEPINRALLRLRENGAYDDLNRKWFGTAAR
ncbi:transporter substrate-binding domain-containing protein [Nereida sp. MMG025]|uniref:transporter substrate-binding domain-containing protein n=1 Tax=Nereida sp. MMG025 TaxID=2909981 RepID=UPI001F1C485E|nr:transporter substrate-binding domain-containing protein [Nereida sp. MMG025]MCF6444745.1 transporter substrate-binding domain-containing protein [Nereida sp. MMG025]